MDHIFCELQKQRRSVCPLSPGLWDSLETADDSLKHHRKHNIYAHMSNRSKENYRREPVANFTIFMGCYLSATHQQWAFSLCFPFDSCKPLNCAQYEATDQTQLNISNNKMDNISIVLSCFLMTWQTKSLLFSTDSYLVTKHSTCSLTSCQVWSVWCWVDGLHSCLLWKWCWWEQWKWPKTGHCKKNRQNIAFFFF